MTVSEDALILGRAIRALRERSGRYSRSEFAHACHTSEVHLRNIENGHKRPSAPLLDAIETQLGTEGALSELAANAHSPVHRRSLLHRLALTAGILPEPGTDRLDLAAVQTMTAGLRRLDNDHGGVQAHHSVSAYFENVAYPMFAQTSTERERQQCAAAVAELALLAGWSAFDAAVTGAARAYFDRARTIAAASNLTDLACETLIAMSNRAAIAGDAREAEEAARAAVDTAVQRRDWALAGEARMALAHATALAGDARATTRVIRQAAHDFDRADRSGAPAWIAHVGTAWFEGRIAQCLHLIGDRTGAASAAERTTALSRPGPRGAALNLAHTALVMFAADRPEEAATYARRALKAGRTVHSARLDDYQRRLTRAAAPFGTVAAVAELQSALAHH